MPSVACLFLLERLLLSHVVHVLFLSDDLCAMFLVSLLVIWCSRAHGSTAFCSSGLNRMQLYKHDCLVYSCQRSASLVATNVHNAVGCGTVQAAFYLFACMMPAW